VKKLQKELREAGSPEKAKISSRFFKTGPGHYGEGDVFLGVTVPETRKIIKNYLNLSIEDLEKLLHSKEHEFRYASLLIAVYQFEQGNATAQKKLYDFYLRNTKHINNWDLVDTSAEYIVGEYLENRSKAPLIKLAKSASLWERRIAIIATFAYIKKGESKITLEIAEILLHDKHDLIQKAVGWMLREVGKRASMKDEITFLDKYAKTMPRTMLRYAIERFSPELRYKYMVKS
jgi:3-methyladenine DNA glycosylase AlkD